MGIHLPDEVQAALMDAGLSPDEVQDKTGDELRKAIGDRLTYELVVALAGQRLTVARSPGHRAKLPQDDLIERNLDVLRCRLVDGLSFKATGREVGLTGSRVAEILRVYFGVDAKPRQRPKMLAIPAAALPVAREALRSRMASAAEDLLATLNAGDEIDEALRRLDDVKWLLRDVQGDEDTEVYVGSASREPVVAEALEKQLAIERHRGNEANADTLVRLIGAMP